MADNIPDQETLTEKLNALIAGDRAVTARWLTDEELLGNPELVKTMAVKPPMGLGRVRLIEVVGVDRPLDLQACGGTHIARTGEIGPVSVRKVENKGRKNRRVNIDFAARSEEHTSELQSLRRISYAVFCLKKNNTPQAKKSR